MVKLSNTLQRQVILEELSKLNTHPTADELYLIIRKRLPKISLGTVYRNLEVLSTSGKILKLETSGKQKRFDGCVKRHFHKRCLHCNAVKDVEIDGINNVETVLEKIVKKNDLQDFNLEFSEICPDCKAKEPIANRIR